MAAVVALDAAAAAAGCGAGAAAAEDAWFVVCVRGNGDCLFSCLALVHETWVALAALATAGGKPGMPGMPGTLSKPLLDGHAAAVLARAREVRARVVAWYASGLERPLPTAELLADARGTSRIAQRGDLLAMHITGEASGLPVFVPHTTPTEAAAKAAAGAEGAVKAAKEAAARTAALEDYLRHMARDAVMGGVPEWQAWAYMTRLAFATYTLRADGTIAPSAAVVPPLTPAVPRLRARVPPDVAAAAGTASAGTASAGTAEADVPFAFAGRLFLANSHYALLLTAAEYTALRAAHGAFPRIVTLEQYLINGLE